jgi:hypothetical protein
MTNTALAMPMAFGPRGGKAPDVVVSDAALTSVAAGARRRIAKTTTKTVNAGGGGGGGGGGDCDSPPAYRCPLKCGTYLIAHPLMTGYFARSVIMILDHTEEGPGGSSETEDRQRRIRRIWRRRRQWGGHVRPDRESAGSTELADPAWRQLDLLRRNWEEKRSRRLEEEDGGGGGGGDGDDLPRRTAQQLAWRERTTQQPTKAMETTKALMTRTANARVKARSGVCECVDCCCCFRSSWDRWTRSFEWPLSPSHRRRRVAVEDKSSRDNDGGADDPRRTTAEPRCRCFQVGHATTTMTRTTTRRPTTTIGSSALALLAFLACITPPCSVVRCRLRHTPLVVVLHRRCHRTAPPLMFRGVKLCVDECY